MAGRKSTGTKRSSTAAGISQESWVYRDATASVLEKHGLPIRPEDETAAVPPPAKKVKKDKKARKAEKAEKARADAEAEAAAEAAVAAAVAASAEQPVAVENEAQVAQHTVAALTTELDALRTEMAAVQAQAAEAVTAAEKDAKSKGKKAKALAKESEELQRCVEGLRSREDIGQRTSSRMAAKINESAERIGDLEKTLGQLEKESSVHIETLSGDLEKAQERVAALQRYEGEFKVLNDVHATVVADLESAEQQVEKLGAELESAKAENERLDDELKSTKELAETTAEMYKQAMEFGEKWKEAKKQGVQKDRKIKALESDLAGKCDLLERLGDEKASCDARIAELLKEVEAEQEKTRAAAHARLQEGMAQSQELDFCSKIEHSRSLMSIESPRFVPAAQQLEEVACAVDFSAMSPGTPKSKAAKAATPRQPGTPRTPRQSVTGKVNVRERSLSEPMSAMSVPSMYTTPKKGNTAPALYAQQATRDDRDRYRAALDEQVHQRRRSVSVSQRRERDDRGFFNFGAAGSGAPIRDTHNEVVTNVTFTRSTNYLPVDHPMSAKKKRATRHF